MPLRTIAIRPVRTSSVIPYGRIRSMKGLDFVFSPADFDHHFVGADIDDLPAEDIDQFANLASRASRPVI